MNALGHRDPERPRLKPPGVQRVLLLGDSMVFGTGLELGSRCGDVLDARLGRGVEVINAAVAGWGTDQEHLYLCREGFGLEPDVVVLALCMSNDVANNMLRHQLFGTAPKPRFVLRGQELVYEPPVWPDASKRRAFERLLQRSRLFHYVGRHVRLLRKRSGFGAGSRPPAPYNPEDLDTYESHWAVFRQPYTPELEAAFRVTEALIAATADSCAARGIPFILFAFPQRFEVDPLARARELEHYGYNGDWFDLSAPYARAQRLADRLEVPFIYPIDAFREALTASPLFLERDGHPNESGHAVSAASLEPAVRAALARGPAGHTQR